MSVQAMNRFLWALLILIAVGTLAGLYFADRMLTKVARDTMALRVEAEINQKRLEVYESNRRQVEELDYVDELASQILPASQDQSVILAEMNHFVRQAGLGVEEISFDTASDEQGVRILPAVLILKEGARYQNVLNLLKILENNRLRMHVTEIRLAPSESDRSSLSEVALRMNIYTKQPARGGED